MKQTQDPGLGTSYQKSVRRMLTENGSYNIQRIGTVTGYKDFYKYLIDLPVWKFAGFLIGSFLLLNCLFALGYFLIGTDQLQGIPTEQHPYLAAFYFSTQTFTTVGYGAIAPRGNGASILASAEAFVGLITFSMSTGLLYGRFSRPSSRIAFTHNILLTPHKNGMAMMFKMVNQRNNVLLNTKVNVILTINRPDQQHANFVRSYYELPLEVSFVRYFPLTWTIVHVIDEQSPLNDLSLQALMERDAEVLILVEAFDETFSQMVVQKHSYAGHQWLQNVRFKRNFSANDEGKIILHIDELNEIEELQLN